MTKPTTATAAASSTEPLSRSGSSEHQARDERREILDLLSAGTISTDEAMMLLDALGPAPSHPTGSALTQPVAKPRAAGRGSVRIRVLDGDATQVNLAVPVALIEAGLSIAEQFAGEYLMDAKAIREAVMAGMDGPILEVNDGATRVEITVE